MSRRVEREKSRVEQSRTKRRSVERCVAREQRQRQLEIAAGSDKRDKNKNKKIE